MRYHGLVVIRGLPLLLVLSSCSLLFDGAANDAGAGAGDAEATLDGSPDAEPGSFDAATPEDDASGTVLQCDSGFTFDPPDPANGDPMRVLFHDSMTGWTDVGFKIGTPDNNSFSPQVSDVSDEVGQQFTWRSEDFITKVAGQYRAVFTVENGQEFAECSFLVQ